MKIKALILVFLFTLFVPQALAAKPTPPPPAPKSVCIDAGHGGTDSGAVNGTLTEKAVNLDVAFRLQNLLTTNGYTVYMTRTDDSALSNADRYNFCNSKNASLLISVHHNGSTDSSVDYTSALYMKKADERLAQIVASNVSGQLGLPNNGTSRFASGVLLKANMPATISEGFFLTNMDEYNYLTGNTDRLDKETTALYNAIQAYLSN